ncbi:MAG: large extracellular alpha-helical protein, partial [Gammaproteobacteria bacterium]
MIARSFLTAVLSAFVCALAFQPANAAELSITRVTPVGDDVPPANQIVIEFNRPVVPLGRMERRADELPITVTPALSCKWRWINRQTLACNLDEQDRMVNATRYTVTVERGIQAMDGATTAAPETYEFITRRPRISNTWFKTWRHPGVPVLRLVFNQPVSKTSVEDTIELAIENESGTMRVRAEPDPDDRELPRYFEIPGEKLVLDAGDQRAQRSDEQLTTTPTGEEARRVWLAAPVDELPLDREITVNLEAGLVSALGPERGVARQNVIRFHTFAEFSFLGVVCVNNDGERVVVAPGERDVENPERMCNPLASVSLSFSAPVLASEIARAVTLDPDLAGGREDYDPWDKARDRSRLQSPHYRGATYDIWLPERLQAFQRYVVKSREPELDFFDWIRSWVDELPETDLRDEFGRPLDRAIDLTFWTNHRKPDFELVHHDAVLESAIDSVVPLYVTNLEEIRAGYRLLDQDGVRTDQRHVFSPPEAEDVAFGVPLGAREMTGGKSGAVFGSIYSKPEVPKSEGERRFFAQITPYQVHVKVGHFNTLVWVTDLETGEPVDGATVSLYRDAFTKMGAIPSDARSMRTDTGGVAMFPGTATLDPTLETFGWRCYRDDCEKLFIRVDGKKGMALLPLNGQYRVDVYSASNYAVYSTQQQKYGHIHTWGTTAQGVYRAGDTIRFKLYVRDQRNESFVPAQTNAY